MFKYDFCIGGLTLTLKTPMALPESERLAPFAGRGEEGIVLTLIPCDTLPPLPERAVRHGYEWDAFSPEGRRVWHSLAHTPQPYAVTEYGTDGAVRLLVKEEYLSYFTSFSAVLNRVKTENLFLSRKRLLLHAALCDREGRGILLIGPSGVGKSTQAALHRDLRGARILNGDRALLHREDGQWWAYGSPWAGSSGIFTQSRVKVAASVLLSQGEENHVSPLGAGQAFAALMPHAVVDPRDGSAAERAMELVSALAEEGSVFSLQCRPDEGAVKALEEVIFHG